MLSAVILLVFNFLFNNKYRREKLLIGLFVFMVFYFSLMDYHRYMDELANYPDEILLVDNNCKNWCTIRCV